MNIILFLDQKDGMLFGGRRQTKDRVLMQYITNTLKGSRIYINNFSISLFDDIPNCVTIDDNFLTKAECEDFCIVENEDIGPYMDKVESIQIFRWDKVYPSTFTFSKELLKEWEKVVNDELSLCGTHPTVYEEIWLRKDLCK